jgi:hypothetical protein
MLLSNMVSKFARKPGGPREGSGVMMGTIEGCGGSSGRFVWRLPRKNAAGQLTNHRETLSSSALPNLWTHILGSFFRRKQLWIRSK